MRAAGFDWEHEIRVALPYSYSNTDTAYPVLWILDNQLEHALTALSGCDLILVSVGAGRVPRREFNVRRVYDFTPTAEISFDGPGGDYSRRETERLLPELLRAGGGAAGFLDFLVHTVRPALAAEYRMDAAEHGLFGFSAGGTFVGYALFAKPEAFALYICGSPALNRGNFHIFRLEETYAAEHADLPVQVFFGAGEAEMSQYLLSGEGIVSSMARMVETLSIRGYPSLRMQARIFPGESHDTVLPHVLSWGVRSLWGDRLASRQGRPDREAGQ
jgi:predicted alpha/beta superfamily hydrolase